MKKQWFIVLVFLLSVTIFSPNHSVALEEVKIGHLLVVINLPTYVAIEKGYFQEQGVKAALTPFESGSLLANALVAGRLDAISGSGIVTYWMVEQNLPGTFKIFMIYQCAVKDVSFVLMVAKDSPMKGMKDLKGKRIGTFPGITSLALAKALLRPYFDPDKEVTIIETPPGNIVQALAAGQIDAYFTPEPFGMMAEAQGVGRHLVRHPLQALKLQHGFPGAVFAFNSKFLKEKPLLAKKVKSAIDKGADFIRTNEREARKFLPKYTNLPESIAMKIPLEQWIKVEQYNKSFGQPYFDVLKKEGLFQKHIDTSKLYYEE